MRGLRAFGLDDRGGTAVETALVLPVFVMLVVGGVYAGLLAFTTNSLHFAVQEAARCSAVKTTVCTSAAATQAYAQAKYAGPNISPAFVYSTAGCGHTVQATATFGLELGVTEISVPLSATACYP